MIENNLNTEAIVKIDKLLKDTATRSLFSAEEIQDFLLDIRNYIDQQTTEQVS